MAAMSLRAYARHRGVSLPAVQKAIATGRITTLPDGQIDPAVADRDWAENTRYSASHDDDGETFGASQYTKARAVREHYQARLAKIEYEERVGSLVSKDEIQVAAFNLGRQARDAMLNIPGRLAAQLAAETDEAKCFELLDGEIRKALNGFAESIG